MNYYKRHIGDYAAATRHLSMLEHGAYTLLMDTYYTGEAPLPADVKATARKCGARTKDEIAAIETVLNEFFVLEDDGWHQKRCDDEIAAMLAKAQTNRDIGRRGGRPKKETQTVISGNPKETQTVSTNEKNRNRNVTQATSHKPLATSQYSEPIGSGGLAPPTDRDVIFANGVPLLTAAGVSEKNARSMLAGLCKRHTEPAVVKALDDCARERPVEPVAWLQAALSARAAPASKQSALEQRNRQVAEDWAKGDPHATH